MGDTFNSLIDGAVRWLQTPFNTRGSALNWVLFVGLLIAAVWFWQIILIDLRREF